MHGVNLKLVLVYFIWTAFFGYCSAVNYRPACTAAFWTRKWSRIMSHESQNAKCWEYLMNLPFILDLTKSQHPCITEELQKQTVLYDKYKQMCHTSLARLSYVRLEGHTVLCWFMSSGMWSYVLGQVVLSVLKALQSFETMEPLAQWHSILSHKTWTLMSQTVWWFCEETNGLANFVITPCINEYPTLYCPTNAHNVKKRKIIKTF